MHVHSSKYDHNKVQGLTAFLIRCHKQECQRHCYYQCWGGETYGVRVEFGEKIFLGFFFSKYIMCLKF